MTEKSNYFSDVAANHVTLWLVSVPDGRQGTTITSNTLGNKTALNNPRARLSMLFPESLDDNTYIIVHRTLLPGNTMQTSIASHKALLMSFFIVLTSDAMHCIFPCYFL